MASELGDGTEALMRVKDGGDAAGTEAGLGDSGEEGRGWRRGGGGWEDVVRLGHC